MGPGATQRRRAFLLASECCGLRCNTSVKLSTRCAHTQCFDMGTFAPTVGLCTLACLYTHTCAHTAHYRDVSHSLPSLSSSSQTPTEYSSGKERAVEASSEDDVPEDLDSTLVTEVVEEEKSKSTTSSTVQEGTAATNSHAVSPVKSQTAASLLVVTPLSHGGAVLDARQEPDEVGHEIISASERFIACTHVLLCVVHTLMAVTACKCNVTIFAATGVLQNGAPI